MGILRGIGWIGIAVSYAFAIAVPSNDAAVMRRQDPASDCATGPGWASPVLFIGSSGSGGSYVSSCETQWGGDYTPITGIEVWRKGDDEGGRIAGMDARPAHLMVHPVLTGVKQVCSLLSKSINRSQDHGAGPQCGPPRY